MNVVMINREDLSSNRQYSHSRDLFGPSISRWNSFTQHVIFCAKLYATQSPFHFQTL